MLVGVLIAALGLVGSSVATGGMIVEPAHLAPAPYPDWAHYVRHTTSCITDSHTHSTGCGLVAVAMDLQYVIIFLFKFIGFRLLLAIV